MLKRIYTQVSTIKAIPSIIHGKYLFQYTNNWDPINNAPIIFHIKKFLNHFEEALKLWLKKGNSILENAKIQVVTITIPSTHPHCSFHWKIIGNILNIVATVHREYRDSNSFFVEKKYDIHKNNNETIHTIPTPRTLILILHKGSHLKATFIIKIYPHKNKKKRYFTPVVSTVSIQKNHTQYTSTKITSEGMINASVQLDKSHKRIKIGNRNIHIIDEKALRKKRNNPQIKNTKIALIYITKLIHSPRIPEFHATNNCKIIHI